MQNLEKSIRERAYYLWMADGCPDGAADSYWLSAQREVLTMSMSKATEGAGEVKKPAAAKKKPAAKAKAADAPVKTKRRAA